MRASPAFRLCIRRAGQWRAAVAVLLVAALAVQCAWLAARIENAALAETAAWVALDLVVVLAAAGLMRVAPVELHWDTERWRVVPAGVDPLDAPPGRLAVAIDLGNWMLLRFEPDARRGLAGIGIRWLPVQRRGLEAQWHALRCAVYCARPAGGQQAGATLGAGPTSQE